MGRDASQQNAQARTLQAWQLALLRFAVTLEASDGQAARAIANELDRSGRRDSCSASFAFFRKTTDELCSVVLRPDNSGVAVIRRHLGRMPDGRLKRAFQAAVEPTLPAIVENRVENRSPDRCRGDLWRGLAPRRNGSR